MIAIPGITPSRLRSLLIALLIMGQLVLSALLVYVGSPQLLLLGVLLLAGAGGVLIFLRWPPVGLIVASLSGLVVPYLGPSGLNVTMMAVAMLLGLWLMDMMVRQRQIRLAASRPLRLLLLFVFVAIVSFAIGQLPWVTLAVHAPLGAQLGGLAIFVLSVGAFLLTANQIHDLGWLSKLTWLFLALGSASVIVRLVLPRFGISMPGLFQTTGSVFYIWLTAIAFSQAVFNQDLDRRWRWVLGALVVVILYVVFVIKFADTSAWLSCLICLGAIIAFRSWRAGLALVPFGVLATIYLWSTVTTAEDYSISTRFDAFIIMAQVIKISPLWGLGFANYYWYTPFFPIRGYEVTFNSHNNYVDIVAQTGLVGLICYLWFFWEAVRLARRLQERTTGGFAQAYIYGAVGGVAGMVAVGLMGDWVLPFFYNIGLSGFRTSMLGWLFLGGLVSLEQIIKRQTLGAAT
jgi:hypothetical protein